MAAAGSASSADVSKQVNKYLAVENMVRAYQVRGHFKANLDPLGISEGPRSFSASGFNEEDEVLLPSGLNGIPGKAFPFPSCAIYE